MFTLAAVNGTYHGLTAAQHQRHLSPAEEEVAAYEQLSSSERRSLNIPSSLIKQSQPEKFIRWETTLTAKFQRNISSAQLEQQMMKKSDLPFPNGVPLSGPGGFNKVRA